MLVPPGSPPLARGTRWWCPAGGWWFWLTPARAGNTPGGGVTPLQSSAHPRSRGEHVSNAGAVAPGFGSPPLARGTRVQPAQQYLQRRLTPARAGNTHGNRQLIGSSSGSPPLARGTQSPRTITIRDQRLTPARAGNTDYPADFPRLRAAHPRSRGEH